MKEKNLNLEKSFEQNIGLQNILPDNSENISAEPKNTPNESDNALYPSAFGVIRIDKIGVLLPIFEDTSNESLSEGAGILENTDLPSSEKNTVAVLAGHRGGINENQTFLNIHKLEKGDKIKITSKTQVLYYSVTGQEIINDGDWSKFTAEEEKTKLILMSCHPYPQNYQRILVTAELENESDNS